MRFDLVQEVEGFTYEWGLDVESFLNERARLVGQPYNHHDVRKQGPTVQTILAHYRTDKCDIYQNRVVEHALDGKEKTEIRHELSFSGNQQNAGEFLEALLQLYK